MMMMTMIMNNFKNKILKRNEKRNHKFKNSISIKEIYKELTFPKNFNLNKDKFFNIIRDINELLGYKLVKGESIDLPHGLGTLEIRKYKVGVIFKNGKIVHNKRIDWNETLNLWERDKESFEEKRLVRYDSKYVYRLIYNKRNGKCKNLHFYEFKLNRNIKHLITQKIKEGELEAYLI